MAGGDLWKENREEFRRQLTRLLADAHSRLELAPSASAMVTEYIENYEFGLAYELIMYELRENNQPAGDAAPSLRAAAVMMGLEQMLPTAGLQ